MCIPAILCFDYRGMLILVTKCLDLSLPVKVFSCWLMLNRCVVYVSHEVCVVDVDITSLGSASTDSGQLPTRI